MLSVSHLSSSARGATMRRLRALANADSAVIVGTAPVFDTIHALQERASDLESEWKLAALICGPGNPLSKQLVVDSAVHRVSASKCIQKAMKCNLVPQITPRAELTVCQGKAWPAVLRAIGVLGGERRLDDVAAILQRRAPVKPKSMLLPPGLSLWLDGIGDPGNIGALARSAAFLGVNRIFVDNNCAWPFSHKAIAASRGAALCLDWTDVREGSLDKILQYSDGDNAQVLADAPNVLSDYALVVAEASALIGSDPVCSGTDSQSRPGHIWLEPFVSRKALTQSHAVGSGKLWEAVQNAPRRLLVLGSEGSGLSDGLRTELVRHATLKAAYSTTLQKSAGSVVARAFIEGASHGWSRAPGACLNVATAGSVLMAQLARM